ncbi:MAG: hypothetical protein Q9P01_03560 [Anaerolineae bacterium]|nr:hypothetical protein [Anaerolineae bacterium]MDQ7033927.1 hypothetical protein [Anaerolineae bacterium]
MISELLEGVLGGGGKGGGSILSESKEAVFGGCLGLLMSTAFFFFFFSVGMALLFGVTDFEYQLTGSTVPLILVLGASGFLSPLVGVMFGLQSGRYSATRHVGCFILYIGLILGVIAALVLAF